MVIQEPVQAAIWQCLNHYAFSDATFLAERLYAEVNTDEALFLLATCYYRYGKPSRAYTLLKSRGHPTPACRFLFAQCCVDINRLSEAEAALVGNTLLRPKSPDELIQEMGELAPFAFKLLGSIYSRTDRCSKASESFLRSLKLNPFLWSSFETLCKTGERPDPNKVFVTPSTQQINNLCHSPYPSMVCGAPVTQPTAVQGEPPAQLLHDHLNTPVSDNQESIPSLPAMLTTTSPPSLHTPDAMDTDCSHPPPAPKSRRNTHHVQARLSSSPLTPSFGIFPSEPSASPPGNMNSFITPPVQNLENLYDVPDPKVQVKKPITRRQVRGTAPKPPVFSQSGNTNSIQTSSPAAQGSNIPSLRRSTRLFSASSSSVKTEVKVNGSRNGNAEVQTENNNKATNPNKFTSPKAPVKKCRARSSKGSKSQQDLNEINKEKTEQAVVDSKSCVNISLQHHQVMSMQKQSAEGLMQLLQEMGHAYLALSKFECAQAVQLFSELPQRHYQTGWVLAQLGRAYFEQDDYKKADKVFEELRQLEPYHVEGIEVYSTVLWHLQKEVQLSALAQDMTKLDKLCPETWCVMGNCFSLQKEHDVAIKFFERAVQVDPNFCYAYTLLGHEYVSTEELEKAMACFRNAIRVDSYHYNAWYGIGMIYFKQEKFALAEMHFRKALSINPKSSVLLVHVAVTQHALKKSELALVTLNKAISTNPNNPLAKFHKASILFATDKHKEALAELEELKQIVPTESLVYFLIGKVHKKLGNTHLALSNFSWAMDLDPKGANNQIKEAIDKRYVTDDEEAATAGLPDGILDEPIEGSSNNSSMMEDVQLQAIESDESL